MNIATYFILRYRKSKIFLMYLEYVSLIATLTDE